MGVAQSQNGRSASRRRGCGCLRCSNSNCCRQAQVLGDQQRPRPESGRKGPDWEAHHLSGAKIRSGVFGVAQGLTSSEGDEVYEWEMPTIPSLRRPGDAQVGEGTRRLNVQRARTRPDVSCCELIDVVQATEYRVCDDLSGFPLRRRPRFFRIARCSLSVRSMRPPMIEVRNVRG
jgi:hypothetical protein